ncbi:MAG: nucleotidyltransferase domain-containing protein [bacterium]
MNPVVSDLLSQNRDAVTELCHAQKVSGLEIFGSATTADFDPEKSDLDFLVEFQDPDRPGIADRFMGLAEGLEQIFSRKVDLVTGRSLKNPFFISAINRSRQVVYAG